MITIPTCELVGLLTDTIPFACADEELPEVNAVKVFWDGEMFHAQATDRYSLGWAQWKPGDDPDRDEQEDLFTEWGGADDPWSVLLPLDDAKDVAKVFKLPAKEGWTPLTVENINGQLKVVRKRDGLHSAITQSVDGVSFGFPNLAELLAKSDAVEQIKQVAYDARRMALFGKVRQRGSMSLTFTGENRITHVTIGERFVGAIMPVRVGEDASS